MFDTIYQELIYKRTYSRWLESEKRREEWSETVTRYSDFFLQYLPEEHQPQYLAAIGAVSEISVMPSMRALWTAGPALARENICGYNCSYTVVDTVKTFAEILYILLCGSGVGFSVERQYINKLPKIADEIVDGDTTIVFKDSKRGWAEGYYKYIKGLFEGVNNSYDLTRIRPKGARLKTFGGRASGPDPLEDLLKFTRRKFESCKGRNLNSLECFDLVCFIASVVVVGGNRRASGIGLTNLSDDRLAKAKSGEFWLLNPQRSLANISAAYTEKPDTRKLISEYLKMIESNSGERGIFNREAARFTAVASGRRDPDHEFGCNPCFTGDMKLLTIDGYKTFSELSGQDFSVVSYDGTLSKGKVWRTGVKPVVEVVFEGSKETRNTIKCTADHVFMLTDGTECRAKDLKGERVRKYVHPSFYPADPTFFVGGFITGDGILTELLDKTKKGLTVCLGDKDSDVKTYMENHIDLKQQGNAYRYYSKQCRDIALRLKLIPKQLPDRYLPDLSIYNVRHLQDFLCGLFSANGSVIKGSRVSYKSTSYTIITQIKGYLSVLGIESYITTNKPKMVTFDNGDYLCQESYDLNIIREESLQLFNSKIGFLQAYKVADLQELLRNKCNYIKTVQPLGIDVVYDFSEPNNNWGVVNGVVAHNCGEILLRPDQFCNLTEVIVRPEDTLKSLKQKVEYATILGCLQSTLTDFKFISRRWKQNCEEERLLGVSLTGLRDHSILNHINSKAENWLREMKATAIDTAKKWAEILNIPVPAAITCVKPSGTVSQLVDSSSGLHPRYAPYYVRRVRIASIDPVANLLKDKGIPFKPEVGDNPDNPNTLVFEFPIKSPEQSVMVDDVTALEQLQYWKMLKQQWCEHNPSCTIYVKEHEWTEVLAWVDRNWNTVCGITFLPYNTGVYQLAPYEEIEEDVYESLVKAFPHINFEELSKYELSDQTEGSQEYACAGGACEII